MSCPAVSDLTHDLWTQILKHVDYKQCLSSCALVCPKLARAAAAAVQSVSFVCQGRPQRLDGFLAWSSSHGSSLTRLHLQFSNTPICQLLCCPNLVELHVSHCTVQLCGREHFGLLHSCTALTSLRLEEATLLDGGVGDGLAGAAPAAAAQLQQLELTGQQFGRADQHGRLTQALRDRLIPHLTSLTELALGGRLQSCCTEHISTIVGLQKLSLKQGPIAAATLPGIECLTALEDLSLNYCDLEPFCLLPLTTGLTRLELWNSTLLPQQYSDLGTSQLLQVLARLRALRVLVLDWIRDVWPEQQLAQYSALTASSNLQDLRVNDCTIPTAAWAHMFPSGRKLPHLRTFQGSRSGIEDAPAPQPFDSTAIQRLASSCPGLQDARIDVCAAASLAPLPALLTALTSLGIGPVKPADIIRDLEALSSLQSLSVSDTVPAPGPGGDSSYVPRYLLPLTALTNLTRLSYVLEVEVERDSDEEGYGEFEGYGDFEDRDVYMDRFTNKAPAGSPPDVWVQLLRRCSRNKRLQPSVTDSMVQLLQQQREQLAQQAARIQEQQQQLAAAKAEAAELRGLVQPEAGLQHLRL